MSVLYIALPIALLLGFSGLIACVLCLRNGQFDDLETPAIRILIDEQPIDKKQATENTAPFRERKRQDAQSSCHFQRQGNR